MMILVFPRDDSNPYQRLLYEQMARSGARVIYLGRLTPSRTLNLLLLPAELAAWRLRGARLVHLHWMFGFALPGGDRFRGVRRLAQWWFAACLTVMRRLGLRVVWTAHNVLPHRPVFADDAAARRHLVAACDLVLAHSPVALAGLRALGAGPRRAAIVAHGPFMPAATTGPLREPGTGDGARRFLFLGRILEYKGAEDLVAAFAALPAGVDAVLTVAGQCDDPRLRDVLRQAAARSAGRITVTLDRVPDAEVTALLSAADTVVLPFRQVTTSGSAMLALGHGRPLIVPDLPDLADLPDAAVVRYDGTRSGLTAALAAVAGADPAVLAARAAAARAYVSSLTWRDSADLTVAEMRSVLPRRRADRRRVSLS